MKKAVDGVSSGGGKPADVCRPKAFEYSVIQRKIGAHENEADDEPCKERWVCGEI